MDTTIDGFLGGRLQVRQPQRGFRSGADAVLLAASVPATPGQSVLELGLGAGVASLCLGSRINDLSLFGLEIQSDYAALAVENASVNNILLSVIAGDVAKMPEALTARTFDQVLMNPPYYKAGSWTKTDAPDRAVALGESHDLGVWMDAATRRLMPGGWLTIIQNAPRLADVIRAADPRLGSAQIKPIAARTNRPAELVILRFRKGGRAETRLFAPLILHEGDQHRQDAAHPTELAENVLRFGKKLEF